MKIIKVFLASSAELKHERLCIADFVTSLNSMWDCYGIAIHLVKWEYLDSSMGVQHKQEDYNDQLRQCDMCCVLFWTKIGKYTEIELNTACENHKQICVLFKEESPTTSTLNEFRRRFEERHPEYCYSFANDEQMKGLFFRQIASLLKARIRGENELLLNEERKVKYYIASASSETEPSAYLNEYQAIQIALNNNRMLWDALESQLNKMFHNS